MVKPCYTFANYLASKPAAVPLIIFLVCTENAIPIIIKMMVFDVVTPASPQYFPNNIDSGILMTAQIMLRYNCSLILLMPFKNCTYIACHISAMV